MGFSLVGIGLVVLAGSVSVVALRLRRRQGPAKQLVWLGSLGIMAGVVLVLTGMWLRSERLPSPLQPELGAPAEMLARLETGGRLLGNYVAAHYQGERIGVVVPPASEASAADLALLDGFRLVTAEKCRLKVAELPASGVAGSDRNWYGPDAFDQARPQISADSSHGGWQGLLADFNVELLTMFGMVGPAALEGEMFPRIEFRQITNYGDQPVAA